MSLSGETGGIWHSLNNTIIFKNLSPRTLRRPIRRRIGIGLAFPNGPGRELDTCRGYDGGGAWPMERSQLGKVEYPADVNMECHGNNDKPKRR